MSQGQATRSTFTFSRVTHFIDSPWSVSNAFGPEPQPQTDSDRSDYKSQAKGGPEVRADFRGKRQRQEERQPQRDEHESLSCNLRDCPQIMFLLPACDKGEDAHQRDGEQKRPETRRTIG